MPMVKLQSHEGLIFVVDVETARVSVTVSNLLDALGMGDGSECIPLLNVKAAILSKVIEWSLYHKNDPPMPKEDKRLVKRTDDISAWDQEFLKVDHITLFELIKAANYLDIRSLMDAATKTVANMIKNKSPEEIRQMFNIVNDFTPAEVKRLRKDNKWADRKD